MEKGWEWLLHHHNASGSPKQGTHHLLSLGGEQAIVNRVCCIDQHLAADDVPTCIE